MTTASAPTTGAEQGAGRSPALRHVPVRHDHAEHPRAHRVGHLHRVLHRSRMDAQRRLWRRSSARSSTTCCRSSSPTRAATSSTASAAASSPRSRVMGAIAGSDFLIAQFNATLPEGEAQLGQVHMFIGAMIMAPIAAYSMKWLDSLWEGKIKAGFEMLVNMFSAGIWGFVMADRRASTRSRSLVNGLMQILSNAVDWLVDDEPAAADEHHHRAGEGAVPQQRHQPRRADAARHPAGRRDGIVDPLPPRGQPRPRCRTAAGVHVLRHRRGTRLGSGRGRHPVLRRHPRGVLPVRAHEADADPRAHRGWRDRCHDEHAPRRRASCAGGAGQHHRGARADGDRVSTSPSSCRSILAAAVTFVVCGDHPAGLAQARPRGDGRRRTTRSARRSRRPRRRRASPPTRSAASAAARRPRRGGGIEPATS